LIIDNLAKHLRVHLIIYWFCALRKSENAIAFLTGESKKPGCVARKVMSLFWPQKAPPTEPLNTETEHVPDESIAEEE